MRLLGRKTNSQAVVAQLVELVPSKYEVAGSNPVYRSKGSGNPRVCDEHTPTNASIAQLVEQLICNQQVVGSSPTGGSHKGN